MMGPVAYHVTMSDLNNLEIAELMSKFLKENNLD